MIHDTLEENIISLAINTFKGLDKSIGPDKGGIETCQNWRFDEKGHLKTRPKYSKYNTTSLGVEPVDYLERIYIGGSKYLIGVYDVSALVGTDADSAFHPASALKSDLTPGASYWGQTYKDFHYMTNGVNTPVKTAGTTATTGNMGCTAMNVIPTLALSATVPDTALDSALYKYKFSWVYDGYQDSTASALTSATAETSVSCVILSAFEIAPTNATGVKLWRTEGGADIYYYLNSCTTGYISANNYYDLSADANLDTTQTAPTDNGLPPTAKFVKLHKERIFLARTAANKSRLYYSKIANLVAYPDIFPTANWIDIAPDDGDEITGLAVDPTGNLIIFKKNSIRKVFTNGDPIEDWSVSEPFSRYGCWAPQSIKETSHGVIYLARDGWRVFDGQSSSLISNSSKVDKIVRTGIMGSRFDKCVGHYHDHYAYLSYTDSKSNQSYNNRVLIYDTLTGNFHTDIKYVKCFATLKGSDDWGELYYGDSRTGNVYKEEITTGEVVYKTESDFRPNGTLSNLVVWGGETTPYLELGGHYTLDRMTPSSLDTWSPSALDDFPSAYSISGTYTSPEININADKLYYMYWNETLGAHGNVTANIRTASTSAGIAGAGWSGDLSIPTGSDITGETADDWIQFKFTLSAYGLGAGGLSATPRVYSDGDYAVRLTYGISGTATEDTVDYDYKSEYHQLTNENVNCRLRKITVDHEGNDGILSCKWDMDEESTSGVFCINLSSYPNTYSNLFPTTAYGKKLRVRLQYDDLNELTIKAVRILSSPQPIRY